MPITDVYYASIPSTPPTRKLYPTARQEELDRLSHPRARAEKYYAWLLLEHALQKSLGRCITELSFSKSELGKWTCPDCFFSISHTEGLVAVAISELPVGVDVEARREPNHEALSSRILTEKELTEYKSLSNARREGFLMEKWTQKEALFKASEDRLLSPGQRETNGAPVKTLSLTCNGIDYLLSVASPLAEEPHGFSVVKHAFGDEIRADT